MKPEVWQTQSPAVKLEKMQNKCLQIVTEVYRVTSTTVIKTEIYTLSLSIYLDFRVTSFHRCHKNAGMEEIVTAACNKIHYRLDYRQLQTLLTAEER